jgi:hypothetical protein
MENEARLGERSSMRYPSGKLLIVLQQNKMIIKQYWVPKKGGHSHMDNLGMSSMKME